MFVVRYRSLKMVLGVHLLDLGILLVGDTGVCPLLVPMSPESCLTVPSFLLTTSSVSISLSASFWVGLSGRSS